MSRKLIITEKPSVARDFARVLKVNGKGKGFIENNEYIITWCVGHLVEMLYPESYDEKYAKWKLEDLPFLPADYKYGVIKNVSDQYKIVNSYLNSNEIDTVYWAGDSGKEGQTIEENIRHFGGVREGMTELRVWIDSQTDEEILRGIHEAKPMSDYELLGRSGIMRSIEDYSLGINFSRALSVKYGNLINKAAATKSYSAIAIGRVMTCVLGMVVNREREIRNFSENFFYKVNGLFTEKNVSAEWKAIEGSKYFNSPFLYKENGFKDEEKAKELTDYLAGKNAIILKKEFFKTKKKAPLLFNLAELQSECSKRFKISPAEALQVIQNLYERKLTTYPRTDARVLTKAVAKEISKNIKLLTSYGPTAEFASDILKNNRYKGIDKSPYTDDSKVTDHYAIIPTGQTSGLASLSQLERNVYDMIVRRFLAIFYPPCEYQNLKIEFGIENEHFYMSEKMLLEPGYLAVSNFSKSNDNSDDNEDGGNAFAKEVFNDLAASLNEGDAVTVNGFEIKEGKTSPPKRYTSGNLILAMENAGNLIEDEELREQIKNTGIGTSATRAEILDKLVRIGYLNQNKKTQIISPERLGEMIYEVVNLSVPSLLNPEMTASWEKGLEGITNGSVDVKVYREKLEDFIRKETSKMINYDLSDQIALNINQFTGKDSTGQATRKPIGIKCPKCGGELTTTSFGYGCSNYFNKSVNCRFNFGKICGVDIPEEEFKNLILNGKTNVIDGFQAKKSKSKFSAAIKLEKDENGEFHTSFDFSDVNYTTEYLEGASCPVCNNKIVITHNGYRCEHYSDEGENHCDFYISKTIASKELKQEMIIALLTDGKTETIRDFKNKKGKKFDACLKLTKNTENGKFEVSFDFDNVEPNYLEDVVCPVCSKKIMKTNFGFACEDYFKAENQCYFTIGHIAGKKLTDSDVKDLLTKGATGTIRGFKSKNKKSFDACLMLDTDEDGKKSVKFDFDNVEAKVVKDVVCPICGGNIIVTQFGYGCSNYNRDDSSKGCNFNIGSIAGLKLKESSLKELLNDGCTASISGFTSKKGQKFEAKLALSKNDEGKFTGIKFVFEDNEEVLADVKCPLCGGELVKFFNGYRCRNNIKDNESACKFFVGKVAGVDIPTDQFIKLIKEKKTDTITGFLSRKGLFFDAKLKLNDDGKIEFDFEQYNQQ